MLYATHSMYGIQHFTNQEDLESVYHTSTKTDGSKSHN
jgi:hypothetical protein